MPPNEVVFVSGDLPARVGAVRLRHPAVRHPLSEEHEKIPGQADSAPANFRPLRVIGYTTLVSLVICGLFVLNYNERWITFKDIDFFDKLVGASSEG